MSTSTAVGVVTKTLVLFCIVLLMVNSLNTVEAKKGDKKSPEENKKHQITEKGGDGSLFKKKDRKGQNQKSIKSEKGKNKDRSKLRKKARNNEVQKSIKSNKGKNKDTSKLRKKARKNEVQKSIKSGKGKNKDIFKLRKKARKNEVQKPIKSGKGKNKDRFKLRKKARKNEVRKSIKSGKEKNKDRSKLRKKTRQNQDKKSTKSGKGKSKNGSMLKKKKKKLGKDQERNSIKYEKTNNRSKDKKKNKKNLIQKVMKTGEEKSNARSKGQQKTRKVQIQKAVNSDKEDIIRLAGRTVFPGPDFKIHQPNKIWQLSQCSVLGDQGIITIDVFITQEECLVKCTSRNDCNAFTFRKITFLGQSIATCEIFSCPIPVPEPSEDQSFTNAYSKIYPVCLLNGEITSDGSYLKNSCAMLKCDGSIGKFNFMGYDANCPGCNVNLEPHIWPYVSNFVERKYSSYSYQGCGNFTLTQDNALGTGNEYTRHPEKAVFATFLKCDRTNATGYTGWETACLDAVIFKNDKHTVIEIGFSNNKYKVQVNGENYDVTSTSPTIINVGSKVYPVLAWRSIETLLYLGVSNSLCLIFQGSSGIMVKYCPDRYNLAHQVFVLPTFEVGKDLVGLCGTAPGINKGPLESRDKTKTKWQYNIPPNSPFAVSWLAEGSLLACSGGTRSAASVRQIKTNCGTDASVEEGFRNQCKNAVTSGLPNAETSFVETFIDICVFDLCHVSDPVQWMKSIELAIEVEAITLNKTSDPAKSTTPPTKPTTEPTTQPPAITTTTTKLTAPPTTEAPTEPTTTVTTARPTESPTTTKTPTTEQPTTKTPTTEQPTTKTPTMEQPTTKTPKTEQPTTKTPTTEQPTTKTPTTKQPTTKTPTTEQPTTKTPTKKQPTTKIPTTEQPTTKTPTTKQPTTKTPTTKQTTTKPTTAKPPATKPITLSPSCEGAETPKCRKKKGYCVDIKEGCKSNEKLKKKMCHGDYCGCCLPKKCKPKKICKRKKGKCLKKTKWKTCTGKLNKKWCKPGRCACCYT